MATNKHTLPLATQTPGRTGTQHDVLVRLAVLCLLLVGGLIVSLPAYMTTLAPDLRQNLRLGVPLALVIVTLLAYTVTALKPYRQIALAYLAVSVGLGVARYVGGIPLNWLGWSAETPPGAAIDKIGECLPIILAILIFNRIGGGRLSSLFLQRGQLGTSLALGLAIGAFCLVPFVIMGGLDATLAQGAPIVLSWLPWLVLFSLVNGFMEELWFRGSWMGRIGEVLGPNAALYLAALIFTLMHVIVYWSEPYSIAILTVVWFLLGFACGWVTYKTKSLWGAVLGHTLADILFMLGTFAAFT